MFFFASFGNPGIFFSCVKIFEKWQKEAALHFKPFNLFKPVGVGVDVGVGVGVGVDVGVGVGVDVDSVKTQVWSNTSARANCEPLTRINCVQL